MPKGFLFKEIKSFIEEESNSGCVLLDNEYKGSVSPLNIRCSCGEPFETTFSSFKNFNKRQCNKCGFRIRANKRMHDYEAVKKNIEKKTKCKVLFSKEEYVDSETFIKLRCLCGKPFNTTYQYVVKSAKFVKCDDCKRLTERLNYNDIKAIIEHNNKLIVISQDYKNKNQKLIVRCKCNNTFELSVNEFVREGKNCCEECRNKKERFRRHRFFVNKLVRLYGCDYSFLEMCNTVKDKVMTKHNVCGNIWPISPDNLLNKEMKGCPKCSPNKLQENRSCKKKYLIKMLNQEGYTLVTKGLSKLLAARQEINLICPNGHKWDTDINAFKNKKSRCSDCAPNSKKEFEDVKEFIESQNYILVDKEYINSSVKLHTKCPEGHDYFVTWTDFYSSHNRCTSCSSFSRGEEKIDEILLANNIPIVRQWTFNDCINTVTGKKLRFDFAIIAKGTIFLLIEYDGRQHFEKSYFGNETEEEAEINLRDLQMRDKLKNEYCKKNNIPLLRIPYWEFENIEMILDYHILQRVQLFKSKVLA